MKKFIATLFCLGLFITAAQAAFPNLDPPTYNSVHITTATTTLVKTGPGSIRSICVNTPVAAGTVTVDDALTATTPTMGIITTPAAAANPYCVQYNASFTTGLTIVTVGAQDVTVSFQ